MRELSVVFETSSTMRVLVLSALLACVSAAPSHLFPVALAPVPIIVPSVPVPAGDLQGAAIDAQVRILDQAQVVVDQARELAEKVTANYNEGVVEGNDLAQEKSGEDFWANEEKKWQALNEAQVAAAKLEGSVASSEQVVPYSADESVVAAVPGVVAAEGEKADVKSAVESEVKSEAVSEIKSEEKQSVEVAAADVKSADMKVEGEKPAEEKKEGAIPEIQKFGLALQALKPFYPAPLAVAPSIYQSPVVYPAYRGYPISAVHYPGHFYAPSGPLFIKNAW